ncbi:MAG TPA: class I SAM-dependent methyltransferase, partial [Pirellulales bacterium]
MPAVRDADDFRPRSVQRLERERLAQQAALDAAKSLAERNRMGQFATPPALADQVVQAAIAALPADAPLRFLDPAFGTGAFYSALLRGFASRVESATAFEIDEHYGRPAQSLWASTGLSLHLADFTAAPPRSLGESGPVAIAASGPPSDERKFNLVVCNPPYVRHHHLSADQKRRLRSEVVARTGVSLHGLAGLYCHFLLLSQAWMAADGIGAWLIP